MSSSETGSRQLEKLDNNKGDEERERESWWLRIKCLLKGEAGTQYRRVDTEKHLIYDLGLLYYSRGQGGREESLKGDCDQQ